MSWVINQLLVTQLLAIHAKQITIQAKDMQMAESLRRIMTGQCK